MSYCRTNPKIQKAKNVHKTHEQNVIHYFFIYNQRNIIEIIVVFLRTLYNIRIPYLILFCGSPVESQKVFELMKSPITTTGMQTLFPVQLLSVAYVYWVKPQKKTREEYFLECVFYVP